MSRWFLSIIFGIFLIIPQSALGQDAGIRDTVRIIGDTLFVGRSSPVHVYIFNDEDINSISLSLLAETVNGGFARFDSVTHGGRLTDPSVLSLRLTNFYSVDGESPDTLAHACYNTGGNYLTPGGDIVCDIYLTGLTTGEMAFDSCYALPGSPFVFHPPWQDGTKFVPEFIGATVSVVDGSLLPTLTLADTGHKVTPGSEITYEISGHSPAGYPVTIELVSVTDYDDNSRLPNALPSLSEDNPALFSWTPSSNDVGIWLATFTVQDSAGVETFGSATMQVVSDEIFLVALETVETTEAEYAHGLLAGNLDSDGNHEIFVYGDPIGHHAAYAAYDYSGPHELTRAFGTDDGYIKRDAQLGFFNADDYLDVVLINWRSLLILHGNGDNTFDVYAESEPDPGSRRGALTDYNSDAYMDYVTVGVDGAHIFAGSSDSRFTPAASIAVADTAISINSADFDNNGLDDLAVGTRRGLDIYLNGPTNGYVLSHVYQQTFGSRDIEITNRGSDFNNDDVFDLCLATPSVGGETSELIIYLGNGDGSFTQDTVREVRGQIFANCPGDFNNDAELDIAYINGTEKYLAIIFGEGTGSFPNELRYYIPLYSPFQLECMDIDLDGDLDLVVSSYQLYVGSKLYLFENQTNPSGFFQSSLEVSAHNNAEPEIIAPSGARINKVRKSMASGAYYRRSLDDNNKIDVVTTMGAIEAGAYEIVVRPKPNLGSAEMFGLEYRLNDQDYRLVHSAAMPNEGRVFTVFPDGNSPIQPVNGEFLQNHQPVLDWPGTGEFSVQLADDLEFSHLLDTATVAGSVYATPVVLPDDDSVVYYWRVRPIADSSFGEVYAFNIAGIPTEIPEPGHESALPSEFALRQNHPNPYNPVTEINFQLPEASFVTLRVFNIMGQTVATLVEGYLQAGEHTVTFDAKQSASGVYFYRLECGNLAATRKMILLK